MSTDPRDDPRTEPDDEPVFAAPTPPGALPAEGLADLGLPGGDHGVAGGGGDARAGAGPGSTPDGAPAGGAAQSRRVALRAGAAVLALAVVGGAVAVGVTTAGDRGREPLPAAVTAPREANAVQLVLGSCLRDLPAGDVGRVTVVPCDEEHVAQVVGRTDADPDAAWPGRDALVRAVSATCGPELLGAAGRQVDGEDEGLSFVVLTPSQDGWAADDRTSLCLAVSAAPGAVDLLD